MLFKWLSALFTSLLFVAAPAFASTSPSPAEQKPQLSSPTIPRHVILAHSSADESLAGLLAPQIILEVRQDKQSGLLSVNARGVTLGEVMEKISEVTGLIVTSINEELLQEPVQIYLKDIPLKQAIDRLLFNVNSIYLYSSIPATKKENTSKDLFKVMLMSKKEELPKGIQTQRTKEAEAAKLQVVMGTDLGRAILGGGATTTKQILNELLETGTEKEIKKAIADLEKVLLLPTLYNHAGTGSVFFESLNALKKLDSETAEYTLTNLLETGEESWIQSLAAENLGEVGGEDSIDPLIAAAESEDPLVRDAAVYSLAKIGDGRGIELLLHKIEEGEPAVQQAVVNTMASSENESTKAALNQIETEVTPQDVVSASEQQEVSEINSESELQK